jgi:hypothetical protein
MKGIFNPEAKVRVIAIEGGPPCLVVDDFLIDPQAWVARGVAFHAHFSTPRGNAYPGRELVLPEQVIQALTEAMRPWFKQYFGVRRVLDANGRLSLMTRQPEQLEPRQWICHRDRLRVAPGRIALASVLYLFKDESLGGTTLYRPRHGADFTDRLVHDSCTLSPADFAGKYALRPRYMIGPNAYFAEVLSLPAKWNRLVLYDGMIFHSGNIRHPDRLRDDPEHGRLTLNGFFTGRLQLA